VTGKEQEGTFGADGNVSVMMGLHRCTVKYTALCSSELYLIKVCRSLREEKNVAG
jgi:hypothetical protein